MTRVRDLFVGGDAKPLSMAGYHVVDLQQRDEPSLLQNNGLDGPSGKLKETAPNKGQ